MTFHLLHLPSLTIYEQLQIEEALLRNDTRNWCILNRGAPRAIVMGISGKADELIDPKKIEEDPVPIIRRFSGGGTVIVDEDTVFATFICQKDLHPFPPFPEPIHAWFAKFYEKAFDLPDFGWKENDYVIEERKCGGNAQYLKKDRWLHHTTFLWNFQTKNMEYLLHPKKMPPYRQERSHEEFLCPLFPYFAAAWEIGSAIETALRKRYSVITASLEEALALCKLPHRKTVSLFYNKAEEDFRTPNALRH